MSAREHHTADHDIEWRVAKPGHEGRQRTDWVAPVRVTTPEPRPTASIEAWRSSPAVRKERRRGIVIGFVLGMAVYGIGSLVLVLAFYALATHA